MDYPTLAYLLSKSYLVLTDSGGLQEEAPTFGIPVFVLRNKTERQEGVERGIAKLLGSNGDLIYKEVINIIEDREAYENMRSEENPYGDGKASFRIISAIKEFFR